MTEALIGGGLALAFVVVWFGGFLYASARWPHD